jgi:prolyl oligopeptidase
LNYGVSLSQKRLPIPTEERIPAANEERRGIAGKSNGGLLVGAAMTQRPDLFEAVICGYPLLDMVRFQRFLVAPFWVPEYGTAENPDH